MAPGNTRAAPSRPLASGLEGQVGRLWLAQAKCREAMAADDFDGVEVATEVIVAMAERAALGSRFRNACARAIFALHDELRAQFVADYGILETELHERRPTLSEEHADRMRRYHEARGIPARAAEATLDAETRPAKPAALTGDLIRRGRDEPGPFGTFLPDPDGPEPA